MLILLLFSNGAARYDGRTVVLYLIDGIDLASAKTAAENGAENLKLMFDSGVVAELSYTTSPAPRLELPDKSKPWGGTTSCNVAAHTGCHVFASTDMDDIFLAARDKGIKSVFAGGAKNYGVFKTSDFHYAGNLSDAVVVQKAIDHFTQDSTRLIRLHAQRVRKSWKGPQGKTDPNSAYIRAIVNADNELGKLIDVLEDAGVWDSTYLMIAADHGMGKTSASNHPANVLSSWSPFISFYGPGIKRGETIPYAEIPDLAIMTVHFLGLRPLKGHTDPKVTISPKAATGTLLYNIFKNAPKDFTHPRYIELYLKSTGMKPSSAYKDYHADILPILRRTTGLPHFAVSDNMRRVRAQSGYNVLFINKKGYTVITNRDQDSRGFVWSLSGKRLSPRNNYYE